MKKQVMIAIQARSTSTRLPGKSSFDLGTSTVIEQVIDKCNHAAAWLKSQNSLNIDCAVYLLVPEEDTLTALAGDFTTVTGPHLDVLSRYAKAANEFYPDYICRITGDCPLIPEFIISSIIKMAVKGSYDYTSNTIPELRTAIDGHDCEVMSNRMLQWLDKTAASDEDREHVTSRIMKQPPKWARIYPVVGYYDLSYIKLSVDTVEDMEAVRSQYESVEKKILKARSYGYNVGRL